MFLQKYCLKWTSKIFITNEVLSTLFPEYLLKVLGLLIDWHNIDSKGKVAKEWHLDSIRSSIYEHKIYVHLINYFLTYSIRTSKDFIIYEGI